MGEVRKFNSKVRKFRSNVPKIESQVHKFSVTNYYYLLDAVWSLREENELI